MALSTHISRTATECPRLRLHVLFESSDLRVPFGVSYIRLLQPLGHSSNRDKVELSFSACLPDFPVDAIIVDRMWRHDLVVNEVLDVQNSLFCELDERNIPLIYSIDDNLLDHSESRVGSFQNYLHPVICRRFIRQALGVIVSTDVLAHRLSRLSGRLRVLPNQLDETLDAADARIHVLRADTQLVRFGYMGTREHLVDLLTIVQPIRKFLALNRDSAVFEIVGVADPLDLHNLFAELPVIVRQVPSEKGTYPAFVKWMQREIAWDFAIAPMRRTTFNEAKSDIKFLDYGILGIPGIFSDSEAYGNTVRHRENGLLVGPDYAEWLNAFETMKLDITLRQRMSEECRRYTWECRTLAVHAREWVDTIDHFLVRCAVSDKRTAPAA